MEVHPRSGEILRKWASGENPAPRSADDKIRAALNKLREDQAKRGTLLENTQAEVENKKKEAEKLFTQNLKKAKEEGVDQPPIRPFDLD